MNDVDVYKVYRQLEERQKRKYPFRFYDKDELIDKILENEDEIERLNNIINELEKDLWEVRQLTFIKYNSNEWNNCLSFNDDIKPILDRLQELKEEK